MIQIEYAVDFTLSRASGERIDPDEVAEQCNAVMDGLVKLVDAGCGVYDPAISLDLGTSTVTIEVIAEGFDVDAATAAADSCVRSAIHDAGGATPDWGRSKSGQRTELLPA